MAPPIDQENGMRVEGTYTFPGDIERVFAALTNPDALARAIPSCERFIQLGPATTDGDATYEIRLRGDERRQTYTMTLRAKAARRPAYLKLDMRGFGPDGAVAGAGSLDLVEQADHTVVAYRLSVNSAETSEIGDAPSPAANAIARAACAQLADELYAEMGDDLVWLPESASTSGEIVTPRGRIVTNLAARRAAKKPLAWTERALWMSAGLAMGLGAIALTVGIVRRMGAHRGQAR